MIKAFPAAPVINKTPRDMVLAGIEMIREGMSMTPDNHYHSPLLCYLDIRR
jgi:hypothetical protein